jgi:hypothetical protein
MDDCTTLTRIRDELEAAYKLLTTLENTYERAIDEDGIAGHRISVMEEEEIDADLDELVECVLKLKLDFHDLIQEYGV